MSRCRRASISGLVLSAATLSSGVATGLEGASVVPSGEHLAVVQVGSRCTGTLVAPQVVLYAAHCGDGPMTIRAGPFLNGRYRDVRASRCVAHPDGGPGSRWDVALCFLDESISDVPPARLEHSERAGRIGIGTRFAVVAFGASSVSEFGVKRVGTVTAREIEPYLSIDGPAAVCDGDSGGPVFLRGRTPDGDAIVGIVSATASQYCDGSPARVVRMHEVLAWVEKTAAANLRAGRDSLHASNGNSSSVPVALIIGAGALVVGAWVAIGRWAWTA